MGRTCTTLWISLLLVLTGIVFSQAAEKPIRIGATVSPEGKYMEARNLGAGYYVKKPYVLETIGFAVKKGLNG